MPSFTRNFWIKAKVDGMVDKQIQGSLSADGGFELEIKLRRRGEIGPSIWITGSRFDGMGEDLFVVEVRPPISGDDADLDVVWDIDRLNPRLIVSARR